MHRVQPNAVQRLLETLGRPVGKLMQIGRDSNNPALRVLSKHVYGWIEEGLIKTVKLANRLTKLKRHYETICSQRHAHRLHRISCATCR